MRSPNAPSSTPDTCCAVSSPTWSSSAKGPIGMPNEVIAPSAALWFLMLPLFDAACITIRRLLKRRPPFGADREHLHHIFLLAGFTVTETVTIMVVIAALGVGVGLVGTWLQVPDPLLLSVFTMLGLGYLWMILHSWSVLRFLRRSINRRVTSVDRRINGDRRGKSNIAYMGPERRSGVERRQDPRREEDLQNGFHSAKPDDQSVASSQGH